jgi:transcriptional regulator GlxA family with amidase domain
MTRTFRAFERCTPGEYLIAARLRRAAELLSDARLPLAEVALASGFADQSHLGRRFRSGYGVTPGEYRRRTARHATGRRMSVSDNTPAVRRPIVRDNADGS